MCIRDSCSNAQQEMLIIFVHGVPSYTLNPVSYTHLWMNLLKDNVEEYYELRELFMIFLIFHGNAAIECAFSINKECIVENQNEISLINIRYVYDAIKEAGGIENVDINKKLIQAVRNAKSFYNDSIKKLNDKKK